jgi:polysaccharide pyruvyl transferase WcaK-like protein
MTQGRIYTYIDAATQIENLGDDIILRQLLRMLESRSTLSVDTRNVPDWAAEVIEIDPATVHLGGSFTREILWRGLKSRLGRTGDRAYLFLKPGHIGGRYPVKQTLGRLGLVGLTTLCKALGVGVVRIGFSVDDLKQPLLQVERLQARVQSVYAPRDDVSDRYAESVKVRTTGRSTDLAYTLRVRDNPAIPRNRVVLSFAASTDGHLQEAYADKLSALLKAFVVELEQSGRPVTYCAQVVKDRLFGDRVLGDDHAVERVSFQQSKSSADAIFDAYQAADIVLTNRLHSFLFSLASGALAVVVTDPATHGKIVGIVNEMGLPELLVDIEGFSPQGLLEHTDRLSRDRDRILQAVAHYFDQQTDRLDALMDGWLQAPMRQGQLTALGSRAA